MELDMSFSVWAFLPALAIIAGAVVYLAIDFYWGKDDA